jgi:phosphoglucan,water dikinase
MSEPEKRHLGVLPSGPGCFVAQLAQMSRERQSWRRRLEWVRDAVHDGAAPNPDRLASLAVFLKLVATGAVPSQEDGGHHRPNHHAGLALEIEKAILPIGANAQLRPLVRSILRWLPSHDADFRCAEPLTRIRYIAHRNDIPRELKDEIKRTLQNKLHRSAGPEDLVTSQRLLVRISAPDAGLPPDFVDQFRQFHGELQTFFNAGDVGRDLRAVGSALGPEGTELIGAFIRAHERPLESAERIDAELRLITRLRTMLAPAYARVDEAHAQRMRQADLKLDERAFLLLSERANRLERADDNMELASLMQTMAEAARQLGFSGAQERPLAVLAEALQDLAADFTAEADDLLRARARCDALRVVLGRYADSVLAFYARCARALGPLLGISTVVTDQFAEAEVRASLAFQLARLVEQALRFTARALALSPWQVIVPGTAEGLLQTAERLETLALDRPGLALLDELDGDEEIPPAVHGIFVLHELPFLSHVAIRARAAGVLLAATQDRGARDDFAARVGQVVRAVAGADRLQLEAATGVDQAGPLPVSNPAPTTLSGPAVRDIRDAEPQTAGAKAYGARRLLEVCEHLACKAPRAWFVPFGAMEACIEMDEQSPELVEMWRRHGSTDDGALEALEALIVDMQLPSGFEAELVSVCADERALAVRSSCNAEDLSGAATGAGLFDSIIGVAPTDVPAALRRVWASLYGRRTRAARTANGDGQIWRMAALIQPVVPAELSFIMYTRSPFDPGHSYLELAAGLGETLASATGEGSPFRMHLQREGTELRLVAHSSYLEARTVDAAGHVVDQLVHPSHVRFGEDRAWREQLAARLREVALALEHEMGGPQDVEGAVVGDEIWVLQSRPAP